MEGERVRMRMSFALALGWAIGVAFFLRLIVETTVAIRPGAATDIVNLGASEALAFVVGTLAVLRLHAADAPARHSLALRPSPPLLIVLGLALGFATHIPAESLRVLVEERFPTPEEVLAARAALLSGDSTLRIALVLFFVACVGPLVEEGIGNLSRLRHSGVGGKEPGASFRGGKLQAQRCKLVIS